MTNTSDNTPAHDEVQSLDTFRLPAGFRGRSALIVQLWWLVQGTLFRWSPQFLYSWRNLLLRIFGASIGRGVLIRPSARIVYPWKLTVGDDSWIGDFVELYTLGAIHIGSNAVISQHSYLCTGSHDMRTMSFDIFARPIHVGDRAWLAAGVFVHPGVSIGPGSVVAARSVVTTDTLPYSVYAGSPAVWKRDRLPRP